MFRRIIDHPLFIWTLLALPSLLLIQAYLGFEFQDSDDTVEEILMKPTGVYAVRFLILSLLLTPMR